MSELQDKALRYALRKVPVFPCIPRGKLPVTKRGFYDATTNPATINRWWSARAYNIGIPTGAASGVWVLDIDQDRDGEASLCKLEAEHSPLPKTWELITGGGGRHLWFKYVGPVANSADKIAPGIDVRGDGGYVIAPPSIHKSGRAYAWSVDCGDELAEAPQWLLDLARKPKIIPISERALAGIRRPYNGPNRYGSAALEDEIETLAGTAPGGRNHALNRCTFRLFQLVAGGELGRDEVVNRLIDASHRNGLVKDDGLHSVIATIRSGARAGLQHPRSRGAA